MLRGRRAARAARDEIVYSPCRHWTGAAKRPWLAGRVLLLRTVIESVDAMLAQARSSQTAVDALGEDLSAEAASFTQHWEDWLDMRVRALGHLTPREAVETPAARERLSALLDHLEWQLKTSTRFQSRGCAAPSACNGERARDCITPAMPP